MNDSSDCFDVNQLTGLLSYVGLNGERREFFLGVEGDDVDAGVVVDVFAVFRTRSVMMMRGRGSRGESVEWILVLFSLLLLLIFFFFVVLPFEVEVGDVGAIIEKRKRGRGEGERGEREGGVFLLVEAS
jgi:hypothetical protein